MNAAPQNKRSRRILLPLVVGIVGITSLFLVGSYAANQRSIAAPLAAYAPYDPATYGIPYEIAGFKILAVNTSENTACIPSGMMRITVQSAQPDVQSFLANSGDTRVVQETLKQLPSLAAFKFTLEFIGPAPWNPEQFMSSNARWNDIMKNGCIRLGGPAIIITPTLDPFAPYAPATFGLPDIVAGYRIVTVQTSGNTPCMPVNQIRLTIQAVDPSPDNPMVARDSGDIIFEVKKLHPDIDWQLTYIMPVPFDREQFVALMQAWNKEGCVRLGGPEFTLAPNATP